MKSKVYFCTDITPENVCKLYAAVGKPLPGKVAVKLHSGEKGNQNFIGPELWRPLIEELGGTVVKYLNGNVVYVNVMKNLSVDCDCCAVAEDPCMKDIGIIASADPVAADQACRDIVYASKDPGRDHLVERIESRNGVYTVECAQKLGLGSREYELIKLD